MRDKVNVFYYPDMVADHATLKKAILFFDEIHFMDRPSFSFGTGNFVSVGTASMMRQVEASFRENEVPIYVHRSPDGPVTKEAYQRISADVNDLNFLKRYQEGIKGSSTFRRMQVAPGNYGEYGNEANVANLITTVDIDETLSAYKSPIALFEDKTVHPFKLETPAGRTKNLITGALVCSAKMNYALEIASTKGFIPLADAIPFGTLLGTKYSRAGRNLGNLKPQVLLTDLSFAVFEEIMPSAVLEKMNYTEVIEYRKKAQGPRDEFLGHLSRLQAKQGIISEDGQYTDAIKNIIANEIIPAAKAFRNKLQTLNEGLYGTLLTGAITGILGGSTGLSLFGSFSWEKLIALSGATGAFLIKPLVDTIVAQRALKRECAISYVLALDE
jgi:hypothetical protein